MTVKKVDGIDINFMLLMRYQKPIVELEVLRSDYLTHLTPAQAKKRASQCSLPFPAFKPDGSKSPYLVHLNDFAKWLEKIRDQSRKDWENMSS